MPGENRPLVQLTALFLKLGIIGFGGPAAHIAMMQQEVVKRRGWMTEQQFLDAIGAANLIPGPTSTEMVLYVGWLRARVAGLVLSGICFITPAALLSLFFAVLYVRYATVPAVQPMLHGIQAAVLAVIATAGWQLARTAARNVSLIVIGLLVAAAAALGLGEIWCLLGGGICGMLWLRHGIKPYSGRLTLAATAAVAFMKDRPLLAATVAVAGTNTVAAVSLLNLGLYFLMIGSALYGSGYVLIAFLEGWLVNETHLLTRQQLLDAVAVGQFTPGPVSSTATFIGYLLHRWSGAAVCTLGIFLPSFILVGTLGRYVPRLRDNPWASAFLDSVNAGAVGLIMLVTMRLASVQLTSWKAALLAIASLCALLLWRINATWLVLAGALIGYLWL